MESCIVDEDIYDEFLSESYSHSVKRISGTQNSIFNFEVPKKILEVREKTWDKFFNRYSKEMSDDLELNVDTLEPDMDEEEEEDEAVSREEYSIEQRIPMRKSPTLVQYWINTGNPPYKALLDKNVLSESGSSLSEKEISVSLSVENVVDPLNTVNIADEQKCKNESSCSSVDTAAYILSNANITKKADTIAIIEGAKCTEAFSNMDAYDDNDNINIDAVSDNENNSTFRSKSVAISSNEIQSKTCMQNLSDKKKDELNKFNSYPTILNTQTLDIESIFRHFNKASQNLIKNNKSDDALNEDKVLEMDTHQEKQIQKAIPDKNVVQNMSLSAFHRKKLYSGRYSPVDLTLTETHGTAGRLSVTKKSLHPALDIDDMAKNTTIVNHKHKRFHKVKKTYKKRKSHCVFNKIIKDDEECTSNDKIQDEVNINNNLNNSLDIRDNLDTQQNDVSWNSKCDDGNISEKSGKCKQSSEFVTRELVVILQRMDLSSVLDELKGENIHKKRKNNVKSSKSLIEPEKSHSSKVVNLDEDTVDSNQSTILFYECNGNTLQNSSLSDCLLKVRLNNDFCSNTKKQDGPLLNSKDLDTSHDTMLFIEKKLSLSSISTIVEPQVSIKDTAISPHVSSNKSKTYSNLYKKNKIGDIKMREVKVVLERLPLSTMNVQCTMMEKQALNKNNAVKQKNLSNKSEAYFLDNAGKKYDCKVKDIKVTLERLPANVCFKKINIVTNTDITLDKKKSSPNTSLQTNHEPGSQIGKSFQTLVCDNDKTDIQPIIFSSRSLRSSTSKESNNKFSNIILSTSQDLDRRLDSTQDITFRHENCNNKTSQDNKYSVLDLTSDEDDFIQSIKCRKRLKILTDDSELVNGNSNIASRSPRRSTRRLQKDESTKERNQVSEIEPSDIMQTLNNSSQQKQKRKNDKPVIFDSSDNDENKDDNEAVNLLIKRRVRTLCLNKRNRISSSSENDSKEAAKKNWKDHKNVPMPKVLPAKISEKEITFVTKLWDSESSSDSISFTHQNLKTSISNRFTRYHKQVSKEMVNGFSNKLSSSLESSLINDMTIKPKLMQKEAKANRRSVNKRSSDDIKRKVNNVKKDRILSSSHKLDHAHKTQLVPESTFLSTSKRIIHKQNSLKYKKINDNSSNSSTSVQSTSTTRQLFETKCYYDSSDSSETP